MAVGREHGIRTGEYWAYRPGTTRPLERVLILNPGLHYDASIRVRLVDDPTVVELWTSRAKLPCKWSELDDYLLAHPDVPRGHPEPPEPSEQPDAAAVRMAFTANELRAIVHDEVANAFGVAKVAYNMQEAATATGVSTSVIRAAVRRHDLVPNYAGRTPLFTPEELRAWVERLPERPWKITYR